jgi:hypothetical protein
VTLDFQNAGFPGGDRYLDISVKASGGGGFTVLSPRTRVLATPYAIRSVLAGTAQTASNSLSLGGVASDQYVLTGDARLNNARTPTPGSPDYIQNQNANVQANANLKIDGTATATNVNAFQFYQLNSQRIIFTSGSPVDSIFVGPNIALNSTGINNSFFGVNAGTLNTSGAGNSFFGRNAGNNNLGGQSNTFLGNAAGGGNQGGSFNVYVGQGAGNQNPSGQANTFIGTTAGASSTTGSNNVGVGADAGNAAALGSNNTFIGKGSGPNQPNLNFATAIGSGAVVGTSNTIVLGRSSDSTIVSGTLSVVNGGPSASTAVCINATNQLGVCASSLRYKTDIETFTGGLDIVRRLRPITFNWKDSGISDVGFAAEEVNKIEPLLTTFNHEGEIQGVKYGQVTTVLVNAVKEQQTVIEKQQQQIRGQEDVIKRQQAEIDAVKAFVCAHRSKTPFCMARRRAARRS